MGSSMTTTEESTTENSTEMATPTKEAVEHLKVAISKLDNAKTAASGCDQVCQTLAKCLKDEDAQLAALELVELALLKYGVQLKTPKSNKSNSVPAKLLEMVFPLMWVDNQPVRKVALRVVKMIPTDPRPDCWNKLKTDMHTEYCKSLLNMVVTVQKDWPTLWIETVKFFGTDLHNGANLINQLLGVLEKAYKNPDIEWTRIQAFECWKALIDSFKKASLNPKRITLILIPLRATNHRTEELTKAKYDTFLHLIKSLPKTQDMYDTLKAFLTFCFYSSGETLMPLRSYPRLHHLCFDALDLAVTRACESKCVSKLTKQLVLAFSQCLQLPDVNEEKVMKAWRRLLENISEAKVPDGNRDLIRELLSMLDDLVGASAGVIRSPPMSPNSTSSVSSMSVNTSQSSSPPQEELKSVLADMLYELVVGPKSLTASQLAAVSLYVGNDVMTGTPALMAVQWLLTPGILLSSGCTEKYKTMMNHLINASIECLGGPLSFIPKVLKMATKVISSQSDSTSAIESLTSTWCSTAEVLVRWVNAGGELNQGDAANHDFSCLYSVVQFPVTHLFANTSSWIKVWGQLYQKSAPQVALVSTTGSHEFCDEISSRLTAAAKSSVQKHQEALLVAVVACGEAMVRAHKATNSKWGREQDNVVTLISEVVANASEKKSDELVAALAHCVALLENPVPLCSAAPLVVEKLAPAMLLLLEYPSPSQHLAQQIVSALGAIKAIVEKHWQFPTNAPKEVKTAVDSVVTCAKSHSVRNIRTYGSLLASSICGLAPEESSSSDAQAPLVGSILHPPKDIVGSKTAERKTATPQSKTTPTNKNVLSPLNNSDTPTRRNKRKLDEAAELFVVIKRPTPVKMVLTEHQKEVMRRKADIPALYQDLSQDTQSASQDCVMLPSSPANPPKKGRIEPDEEAVMDLEDVMAFKGVGKDLDTSVLFLEEKKSNSVFGTIEIDDNATMQSVSDVNDDSMQCSQESDMAVRLEDEPVSVVQEKQTPVTPNRRKSIVPVKKEPTVTRSRNKSSLSNLVTRSGKVVKQRQSLGDTGFKSPPKVKRMRKSLPAANNAVSRTESESSEEISTPVESKSPVKGLSKRRGSQAALKVADKELPTAVEVTESQASSVAVEATEELPETETSKDASESSKSSEETLSAASPSIESTAQSSSVSSDDVCVTPDKECVTPDEVCVTPESKPMSSPAIRERSKRKTTPTRKALLILQKHENVERLSQAVVAKSTRTPKTEQLNQPKPAGRKLRKTRSKNSLDENDPKPVEPQVSTDKSESNDKMPETSSGSPLKSGVDLVVVIEKMIDISERVDELEEPAVNPEEPVTESLIRPVEPIAGISSADPEKVSETELGLSASQPEKPAVPESEKALETHEAPVPENAPASSFVEVSEAVKADAPETPVTVKIPSSDVVIPESQDIIESSQATEESLAVITTPRYTQSPKKNETPSSAKWTLRVSDTFTPVDTDKNSSPGPSTPKAVPANEKIPRRIVGENDDRSDSMPSWMHAKKIVSPGNPPRPVVKRISPTDLVKVPQAPSEEAKSESPPPKPSESTPTSSPVQSKWLRCESATPTGRSPGNFPMRTGRAAHLLGLGQAAAARSGEEIRTTLSPSRKEETVATAAIPTQSVTETATASAPLTVSNHTNSLAIRGTLNGHVIASPRVKRRSRMGLSSRFSDGGPSAKEPQTPGSEWIRKTYQPDATPETSILKKPRRTAAFLESDSPVSHRKKRVSFHDPPVSKSLNFFVTSEDQYSGTVHSSGVNDEVSSGKSLVLEEKTMEQTSIKWMRPVDEEKRDSLVAVIIEETEQELEREGRLNHEESSILRQRNYDDKADHIRLAAPKEDRTKRRDENQKNDADENRWSDPKVWKDEERAGKDDVFRWKKVDVVEDDSITKEAEEERLRKGEEERLQKTEEEESLRKEEAEKSREEEERIRREESIRKEEEERVRREEEKRVKEKEEAERARREEEEIKRKEEEEEERVRITEERIRKEEEEAERREEEERRRKEEERIRKEEEEMKREEERIRKEEEERIRKEEEEKRLEEERIRKEEEEKLLEEERIRKEEEEKRLEEERIRKAEKEKRLEEERIRKEEEKKRIEEERIREEEEKKRIEEERIRVEEKKRIEEERIRMEEEENKRIEEERIHKEEEEKKRIEEERIRKEEEEKKRIEEERIHKEEEERIRKEEEQKLKEERSRKEEEERILREEETKREVEEEQRIRKEEEELRIRKEEEGNERRRESERIVKQKLEDERKAGGKTMVAEATKEQRRRKLKRKESSEEANDISQPLKKSARHSRVLRSDSEDSSSSSQLDVQETIVLPGQATDIPQEHVKRRMVRPKKRIDDEIRRKREEERKRMMDELERSDAEWSRKEEIRLGALAVQTKLSVSNEILSDVSKTLRVDSDLSQIAAVSQGETSVIQPVPFSEPGAIYPSLVDCEEPIEKIVDSLTGTAWRRNLIRKFADAKVTTIGHLASLTEEQANRYAIRPPRTETLMRALEKYERQSGKTVKPLLIPSQPSVTPKPSTSEADPEDDLPLSCIAVVSQAVPLEPVDPVAAISTNTLLKELTNRIGVSGILKQLYENSETDVLRAVENLSGVKKLLPKTPLEDLVEECSTRIKNINEVTACNGKLVDLVTNAVAKDAILKSTASALVTKSNGKKILETLFKSVLDHL